MVLNIMILVAAINVGKEVHQFRGELDTFRGSVVYDIDKVRHMFLQETELVYGQGCRYGTDYPNEFRNVVGFNQFSPSNYCNEKFKEKWEDYLMEQAGRIGKREVF